MKPSRSRAYCKDAQRSKIFFETESKAKNFIKFNHAEMIKESGFAPTRCYYCIACDGWHVSSSRRFKNAANKTELVIKAFTTETTPINYIPKAAAEDDIPNIDIPQRIKKTIILTPEEKTEKLQEILKKINQRMPTISSLLDQRSDKILIYNLINESLYLLSKNSVPGFDTQINELKNLLNIQKNKAKHLFKDL